MIKKLLSLVTLNLLMLTTYAQFSALVSINPNSANISQTLNTTVTGTDLFFTSSTSPNQFNIYLLQNSTQIFPNAVSVTDDDHFDANWTFSQGYPTGVYDLYYDICFGCGFVYTLPGAFTLTDTCRIVSTPISATVCQGDSVHLFFNSTASTYQWKNNGSNISGATSQNYYAKTTGSYSLAITGGGCTGPILPVAVTVNSLPVATISPSVTQNICPGTSVTFQASTGVGIAYQWYRNGTIINNAATSSLVVRASGSYKCKLTNSSGCFKFTPNTQVNVSVLPEVTVTKQPNPFNGKDAEINSYSPGTNYATGTDFDALSWTIQGVPINSRSLLSFDLSSIPPGSQITSATLNLYFNPTTSVGNHFHYGANSSYLLRVGAVWDENTVTWNNQPAVITANAITLASSSTNTQNYTNIDVINLVKLMVDTPSTNFGFELRLQTEIKYRALIFCSSDYPNASLRPKLVIKYLAPAITTSNGSTFCSGDSSLLSTNVGAYTYQWKKNNSNLGGATNATYMAKSSGTYTVKVTNSSGCTIISQGKTITVNSLPSATITPGGPTTFCNGDSVKLNANTGANLTYQWKKNNSTISGATANKYYAKTAGTYKVKVTNATGCTKLSTGVGVSVPCRDGEQFPVVADLNIQVFPNPSSGEFTFHFVDAGNEERIIRIVDVTGKLILEKQVSAETEAISLKLEQAGLYKAEVIQGSKVKTISLVRTE